MNSRTRLLWLQTINTLSKMNAYVSGTSFIYGPLIMTHLDDPGPEVFDICCYTQKQGKLNMLSKNYINKESMKNAKKDLKDSNHDQIILSLIGEPKHGTVKNKDQCMQLAIINKGQKRITLFFRNSDFFKKFLVDVHWFHQIVMKELDISNYQLDICFNAVTLRSPFFYIYLQEVFNDEWEKNPEYFKQLIVSNHPIINSFKKHYSKPIGKYKSLERAGRRMRELSCWPIIDSNWTILPEERGEELV